MNEHAERPPQNGWWKGPCCSGVLIGNPVAFPAVSVSSAMMTRLERVACSLPMSGVFPGSCR